MKPYAGKVLHVGRNLTNSETKQPIKAVSVLVEVYGYYQSGVLALIEPILCSFWIGEEHSKISLMEVNSRLILPCAGIEAEPARFRTNKRTGVVEGIHNLIGLDKKSIEQTNQRDLLQPEVTGLKQPTDQALQSNHNQSILSRIKAVMS